MMIHNTPYIKNYKSLDQKFHTYVPDGDRNRTYYFMRYIYSLKHSLKKLIN